MRTRATSTSSSSAATCASAVITPWPSSTLPERTSTMPSGRTRSQSPRRGLAASEGGSTAPASGDVAISHRPGWHRPGWHRPGWHRPGRHRPGWHRPGPGTVLAGTQAGRGSEHGAHDPVVRAAPAQVAVQRGAYLALARIIVGGQQRSGADHHAGDAVTALCGLPVDDRPRDGMRPLGCAQSLYRRYVPVRNRPHRRVARIGGLAVDQHEARAAQAETTTETGALQPEMIPQHVQQRGVLFGADLFAPTVHQHGDPVGIGIRHTSVSRVVRSRAAERDSRIQYCGHGRRLVDPPGETLARLESRTTRQAPARDQLAGLGVAGQGGGRELPQAGGGFGVEGVGRDTGTAGFRGSGIQDRGLVAVLEVAAADAVEQRRGRD